MLVIGGLLAWTLARTSLNPARPAAPAGVVYGSATAIARQLFRPYLLPFEITSVLILIAIMGAVVLARREE
jgi:NADH-quinone oxidoreductase subunit J